MSMPKNELQWYNAEYKSLASSFYYKGDISADRRRNVLTGKEESRRKPGSQEPRPKKVHP